VGRQLAIEISHMIIDGGVKAYHPSFFVVLQVLHLSKTIKASIGPKQLLYEFKPRDSDEG